MKETMHVRPGIDYVGICVVYFCHDGQGNFVMAKRGKGCRDEQGKWDIGGGAVEFHTSVEDTLKKEIKEEYCALVLEQTFLGYSDVHREQDGQKSHWIALGFMVKVEREQVSNGEPHKFEEVRWFQKNTIPTKDLHSQLPEFLNKYDHILFD